MGIANRHQSFFPAEQVSESIAGQQYFCAVESVTTLAPVGNNNVIVTGVTGKRIRVVSINLANEASAAEGFALLHDGSGVGKFGGVVAKRTSNPPNATFPRNDYGWANCGVGASLLADITGAAVYISVTYYFFTPGNN